VKIGTPVSYHRPAHMSSLLAEVIPLAFAAAISPVVFLLQLNTLTGPRPLARGSALTAGAAIVLIIGSTLGVLLGGTGFSDRPTLQAVINIAFGVLLILVGLRALLRPPKPKQSEPDQKPASIGRSFLAGVGGMASNVTTFALYIPALALIAGSELPLGQRGLAGLVILLITLMVAWVPLLVAAVVPGATTRLLPALGGWMTRNDRWIQVVLGFGFGIWLLVKGLSGL
jgi:threonine/homoserine/homoserine lactone efflux protein